MVKFSHFQKLLQLSCTIFHFLDPDICVLHVLFPCFWIVYKKWNCYFLKLLHRLSWTCINLPIIVIVLCSAVFTLCAALWRRSPTKWLTLLWRGRDMRVFNLENVFHSHQMVLMTAAEADPESQWMELASLGLGLFHWASLMAFCFPLRIKLLHKSSTPAMTSACPNVPTEMLIAKGEECSYDVRADRRHSYGLQLMLWLRSIIKWFTHSNRVNHTDTHVLSEVHAVLHEVQFLLLWIFMTLKHEQRAALLRIHSLESNY